MSFISNEEARAAGKARKAVSSLGPLKPIATLNKKVDAPKETDNGTASSSTDQTATSGTTAPSVYVERQSLGKTPQPKKTSMSSSSAPQNYPNTASSKKVDEKKLEPTVSSSSKEQAGKTSVTSPKKVVEAEKEWADEMAKQLEDPKKAHVKKVAPSAAEKAKDAKKEASDGKTAKSTENAPQEKDYLITSFSELNLNDSILRGIFALGIEKPSVIQQKAILPIMNGRHVIAQAQSGTGKTLTFTVAMLHRVDPDFHFPQALVLSPTRELATQTFKYISEIATFVVDKNGDKLKILNLIGGEKNVREDISALRNGPQIVMGTPGRVYHMMMSNKGYAPPLDTKNLKMFVIDEADVLYNKGFQTQLSDIVVMLPQSIQIVLVSATIPKSVHEDMLQMMNSSPVEILVPEDELSLEGIQQYYIELRDHGAKYETIIDLYTFLEIGQSIIYTNHKDTATKLHDFLEAKDFRTTVFHADLEQKARQKVMLDFLSGTVRVLIATDVLARGINAQNVSHVINFDIPHDRETYLHRIGRSGRFGRKGMGITLLASKFESDKIADFQRHFKMEIPPLPDKAHLKTPSS